MAEETKNMETKSAEDKSAETKKENTTGTANAEKEGIVTFKPYSFEQKEYTEIDLSGLAKMTIKDIIDVQKKIFAEREIAGMIVAETSTAFTRLMAAKATGMPIEFFKFAPMSVSVKVARAVREALGAEKETVDHVMQLDAPYLYEGKTYDHVDLNGVGDLTSMNQSEAENRMVREGFVITEASANYLYICTLASMATGLAEEFFTGLPICEATKLKNAVNDSDFFE